MATIDELLNAAMIAASTNPYRIAKATGISQGTIREIAGGKRHATGDPRLRRTLDKIVEHLNLDAGYFDATLPPLPATASPAGRTIRAERHKRRLSQDALAELAGVDKTTISRIETDPAYKPMLSTLNLVAQALQMDVRDLLKGTPNEHS